MAHERPQPPSSSHGKVPKQVKSEKVHDPHGEDTTAGQSFAISPSSAKVASSVRDTAMVKMEKALNISTEDFNHCHIPLCQKFNRDKAEVLYDRFHAEEGGEEEEVQEELLGHAGEELAELVEEQHCENEEEGGEEEEVPTLTVTNINRGLLSSRALMDYFFYVDPSFERSVKFKRGMEEDLVLYKEILKELKCQDGATQSPIGELSLRRLSERLSDLNILDNRPSTAAKTNGKAEPSTVENDAFDLMVDDNL
ncbi:putative Sorting nexin-17-like 2 [Homarus americanus]|uniref:Putative Sorting nexin-17-like 2 n=1 Tax=Homarus americanus TaxID=6706 RepID=A0A8J5TF78_HOMAM|nr:putative Sorting nexin-17-like 2 [Homarus americanus]